MERLQPLVGLREKQQLRAVRGQLALDLLDGIAGERPGASAAGIHHPDFAPGAVIHERRRRTVDDDLPAIPRQTIRQHGPVAVGQLFLFAARDAHFPEVPLLEVLLERVHIVSQPIALALVGRSRIGGQKVDGQAIGRPRGLRHASGVPRELLRVASIGGQPVDLNAGVAAAREKQHRLAVGRPSCRRHHARLAARELFGLAAGNRLAPDLTNGTIGLPVGPGQRVDDESAIG